MQLDKDLFTPVIDGGGSMQTDQLAAFFSARDRSNSLNRPSVDRLTASGTSLP